MIGLPVDVQITTKEIAEALLPAGTLIGNGPVISILGWNAGSQSFSPWAAAAANTNVFAVSPADGIFVRVSEQVTWTIVGMPIADPIAVGLQAGFNLISIPAATVGGYDARTLAETLLPAGTGIGDGPVISILGWNAGSQSFSPWAAAAAETNKFAIDVDPSDGTQAYFVRLRQPEQLAP
jgi:hypothetical protein